MNLHTRPLVRRLLPLHDQPGKNSEVSVRWTTDLGNRGDSSLQFWSFILLCKVKWFVIEIGDLRLFVTIRHNFCRAFLFCISNPILSISKIICWKSDLTWVLALASFVVSILFFKFGHLIQQSLHVNLSLLGRFYCSHHQLIPQFVSRQTHWDSE